MRRVIILSSVALVLALVASFGPTTAEAIDITFTVNIFNDKNDGFCDPIGPGLDCSLREAVRQSNLQGDPLTNVTIVIPVGTYTLDIPGPVNDSDAAFGDLDIKRDVTIVGAGMNLTTIDATPMEDRVFEVHPTVSVRMEALSITNGQVQVGNFWGGGGILNLAGNVTLADVRLANNSAYSGAAIFSYDPPGNVSTSLTDSVIVDNQQTGTYLGSAGIYQYGGELTLDRVTISGNIAEGPGGGIVTDGFASATLTNVTISGNSAWYASGYAKWVGSAFLNNVTITGNTGTLAGGALRSNSASVLITNSIVAGNSPDDCQENVPGSIVSGGYNLAGDNSCPFGAVGDLVNTDPLLGPLADNGGPTETHALTLSSLAIDAGDPAPPGNACDAIDQRGVARPQGAACDMGAYEFVPPPNAPPVAFPDLYSVEQEGTLTTTAPGILGNDTDAEQDPLTAVLETNVGNGVLNLNPDGSFEYSPNPGFFGVDSFTYRAHDGTDVSLPAGVTIDVTPLPSCTIDLVLTYTGGNLNMDFSITSNVTTTFQIIGVVGGSPIPIASVDLPVIPAW